MQSNFGLALSNPPLQECQATPGCNAIVYCGRSEGCGGGCAFQPPPSDTSNQNYWGAYGGCAPEGRYPLHFCSLKTVPDPQSPGTFPGDQGGFTSGTRLSADMDPGN